MSVPKCKECELCREYDISYKYLYCSSKEKQICVGDSIKTSPKWCPEREKTKKQTSNHVG